MQEPIIRLEGVSKRFGPKVALDRINLEIMPGEIFGVVGINGSGKTTLLRTLVGFYKPSLGELFFKSVPFSQVSNLQRYIGIATQDECFYPQLTVKENVEYFGRLYGMSNREIEASLDSTLKLVNLYDLRNMLAKNLSGGMQKRIGIACSIIHSPQVIIMDEPTSDLDLFLRKDMKNLIRLINENGITVIIASHNLLELDGLCHRIGILDQGRILSLGSPLDLKRKFDPEGKITLEDVFELTIKEARNEQNNTYN